MKKKVTTNHLRNMPSRDRSSSGSKNITLNGSGYMRKSEYSLAEGNDYLPLDQKENYSRK